MYEWTHTQKNDSKLHICIIQIIHMYNIANSLELLYGMM